MAREYVSKCYEQAEKDVQGKMADSSAGRCLVCFSVERRGMYVIIQESVCVFLYIRKKNEFKSVLSQ